MKSLEDKVKNISPKNITNPRRIPWRSHRSTRPVSGVILLPKPARHCDRIKQLFKSREMQQTYYAGSAQKTGTRAGTGTLAGKKPAKKRNKSH